MSDPRNVPESIDPTTEAESRVAFDISHELAQRAARLVGRIRSESDKTRCIPELTEVVLEMTDRGLHFYFLHPLELAGVGPFTRSTVELALSTAGRTLPMVVRKTLKSLNDEQILTLADFIDHVLIRREEDPNR